MTFYLTLLPLNIGAESDLNRATNLSPKVSFSHMQRKGVVREEGRGGAEKDGERDQSEIKTASFA
jgi:hypothetical protein